MSNASFVKRTNVRKIDENLEYSILIPSKKEWLALNFDEFHYGPLHLWMRCVGSVIRGYFHFESAAEDCNVNFASVSDKEKFLRNNLTFLANDVPFKATIVGPGGEFYLALKHTDNKIADSTDEIHIAVKGWKHYSKFPIRLCSKPPEVQTLRSSQSPEYIMSISTIEQSSVLPKQIPKMVMAIENHLLFHKCALNISSYEIPVNLNHLPYFMANSMISQLSTNGFLTFLIKGNNPSQCNGTGYKWQYVYQNLVILHHWASGGGNKRLFLFDADEFLHLPKHMALIFNENIRTHSVVNLQLKSTICADCQHGQPDLGYDFSNHTYMRSDKHYNTKVIINPDEAGCMLVHFSLCKKNVIRLDARIAYLAHFDNLIRHRLYINDSIYKFHNYDISPLIKCSKSGNINSLQGAMLQYKVLYI